MKISVLAFTLILLLSGCNHLEERDTASASSGGKLMLIVDSHRQLELEPCGCSLLALGGMDREANQIEKWKHDAATKNFLIVSGGSTFAPEVFKPAHSAYYLKKATYVVEGMNDLGFGAIAPSIDDMALGIDSLKQVRAKAKFSFVTTNLYSASTHTPIFDRFKEFDYGSFSVLVIGLSRGKSTLPLTDKVEARDPVQSVKDLLAELPPKNRLIVALVTLSKTDRDRLQRETPQVNVVVGGEATENTPQIRQYIGSQLYLSPMSRGRAIAKVDFEFPSEKINKFFNPQIAEIASDMIKQTPYLIGDVDAKVKKKNLKKSTRADLEKEREDLKHQFSDALSFPASASHTTVYSSETENLEDRLAQPPNSITRVVEKFKKELRDIALEGEH